MDHLLCGLAANPALPSPLTDRLIALADADIAAELAQRTDLRHDQAVALAARVEESAAQLARAGHLTAADVDPAVRPRAALALLDEGRGDPDWARLLAADPVAGHREELAACPGLPPDVVALLAADPRTGVVAEIALWAAPDVAAGLAAHPHAAVRRAVAANEAAPPGVLAALISGDGLPPPERCHVCDGGPSPLVHGMRRPDPDGEPPPGTCRAGAHESAVQDIRQAALRNPATPAAAAAAFADSRSVLLRRALAARSDLPAAVHRTLAGDRAPGVRADLAANPAIGEELMRATADDPAPEVRRGLAANPRLPLDVLTSLAGTAGAGATLLPRIAAASPAEVEALARSPIPAARMLAAGRRDLPDAVRDRLADDPDAKVVKSIAGHPGLSDTRLRAMVERHGVHVLAAVAANPDAAPALLEELARHERPVRQVFRVIAQHRNATATALLVCLEHPGARRWAAGHPALPPPVVAGLLADPDGQVAEAAAANPALPPAVMADLLSERGGQRPPVRRESR